MTNPDYTAMFLLLDRSGSMTLIRKDMEGGIESLLEEQAKLPGKVTVDVAYFDYDYDHTDTFASIDDLKVSISPRGSTALYDAIVKASAEFGEALAALDEDERPGTVIFTIVTDGEENASMEATIEDVKKVITEQQDTYGWNYMFLGANQDAVMAGNSFGLRKGASLTYSATSDGIASASHQTSVYMAAVRSGNSASFT